MSTKTTAGSRGIGPYKLGYILLYGRHNWIFRTGSTIRIANPKISQHMRTRANKIKEYLEVLVEWGFISNLEWNQHWLTVTMVTPVNMAYIVGGDVYDR